MLLINLLVLLAIVFLLLMLSAVWPPDSPWAPWWRTNKKTARAICKLAKINSKDTVYDLGCGDGEVLIQSAKLGANGVGIEIDPLRFATVRLRVILNKFESKLIIKRKNFFNEDISKASVIVVYLIPKTLERLKKKFLKELKPGVLIVSYKYEIDLPLIEYDKKNEIRLYRIPKSI